MTSDAAAVQAARSLQPSPPSSASDLSALQLLQQPSASPPSASAKRTLSSKRRAAEALLAARYAGTPQLLCFSAAGLAQSEWGLQQPGGAPAAKRRRSGLAAAIDRLQQQVADGSSSSTSRPQQAGGEQKPDADGSSEQARPQLAALQSMLSSLHAQHERLRPCQQPGGGVAGAQAAPQQQQQQQEQEQQEQQAAAVEASTGGLQLHLHQPAWGGAPPGQAPRQQFAEVAACSNSCTHAHAHGWCHSPVRLPHVDWVRVVECDAHKLPSFAIAPGYDRLQLPQGLQILVVENPLHLPAALAALRASMQDRFVAIDLEWRPEFGKRSTPVALLQLASSRLALLVRICRMHYRLPEPLREFLADPSLSLLGFAWDGSDAAKAKATFGLARDAFGGFFDVQGVAEGLGYCGLGLGRLAAHVLGLQLAKSRRVTMSNWEAARLSRAQIKYAALDALVAGQVFRALRLWHSSPCACEACHGSLGAPVPAAAEYACASCGRGFTQLAQFRHHCASQGHAGAYECGACGCTRPLAAPARGRPSRGNA